MAVKEITINGKKFGISYTIKNSDQKRDILFLHGWGSNKILMQNTFSKYLSSYRHIYVDLPGFGGSNNSYAISSSVEYSEIIKSFNTQVNFNGDIIVGHSYGGKVATLLKPKLLVLIASAGIVLKKPLKVKTKIFLTKILNRLNLKFLKRFLIANDARELSSNMYTTFKNIVNEDFSDIFKSYNGDALLFWGKDDKATPLSCAKIINNSISKSKLYTYEGDHYFFLKNAKNIEKGIIDYVK